jgi:tetratricopeptide (TPR) repeat protein
MPVKKYLDKKDTDKWQTPVNNGKDSVGLSTYFNLHEVTINKKGRARRMRIAAASLLLIAAWIYIGYGGGAEKIAPEIDLLRTQPNSMIPVSIKVQKNFSNCGDSLTNRFDQLEGYLEINNKRFTLSYNQKAGTANFAIPYQSYLAGTGLLQFTWNIGKSIISKLNFAQKQLPDTVTIRCVDAANIIKQPLYIRYNDTAGYRSLENDLSKALFRYLISSEQADFSDSSRIVYYESNQKLRADSIVKIIKRKMNINVKEEFIQEIRIPPATPILFLNTALQHNGSDTGTVNAPYDADFYHGMGDNFFMKKQYKKAIDQYALAVKLNPKDALDFYQQGISYEMLGDAYTEKALAQYNAAIKVNPNDASYYYRRASVQYELKQYAPAITDYSKVIALNPANAKAQYLSSIYFRGKSKYFLNNLTGACDDFKKAADAGYAAGKKDYATYCGVPAKAGNDIPDYPANAAQQRETSLGSIEFDPQGDPNTAGLQLIEKLGKLLQKQPGGKLRLSASYISATEQKALQACMNTLVNLCIKNGADAKTQIVQQINQSPMQAQQKSNRAFRNITIQVTGINLDEPTQSKY